MMLLKVRDWPTGLPAKVMEVSPEMLGELEAAVMAKVQEWLDPEDITVQVEVRMEITTTHWEDRDEGGRRGPRRLDQQDGDQVGDQ